ncbi:hypothetical protein [Risungbinella massiliensis]|uniref:hypothetical protein n=1 Tax=Risungbinella massiliensis TaxID=1329796 RepID=UPI0005CC036A|nr:hypothetical protein [Risungbinella massiliensis]
MQEHSHFIKSLPQLQKLYQKILLEVQDLYNYLVPLKLRQAVSKGLCHHLCLFIRKNDGIHF